MKNILFILAVLFALAPAARASQFVMQTAESSYTVVGIRISSWAATSVTGGVNGNWRQIGVQNSSTSASLYCSDSVNISTLAASLNAVVIAPAASAATIQPPTWFYIPAGSDFYCENGGIAAQQAVVIKAR
jgi:hypothetical protein